MKSERAQQEGVDPGAPRLGYGTARWPVEDQGARVQRPPLTCMQLSAHAPQRTAPSPSSAVLAFRMDIV